MTALTALGGVLTEQPGVVSIGWARSLRSADPRPWGRQRDICSVPSRGGYGRGVGPRLPRPDARLLAGGDGVSIGS